MMIGFALARTGPLVGACSLTLLCCLLVAEPARAVCGDGVVDEGEQCDDDNRFGGDGCAANCMNETLGADFIIDPETSFATTQLALFSIPVRLEGRFGIIAGERDSRGIISFVVREDDLVVSRAAVPGLVCTCIDAEAGTALGPGNVVSGGIACGDELRGPELVTVVKDHNIDDVAPDCLGTEGRPEPPDGLHPGVCNGFITFDTQGMGPPGSVFAFGTFTLTLIQDGGTCSVDPSDPAKGPDGVPCTADDPGEPIDDPDASPVLVQRLDYAATSGTVTATILDANNNLGTDIAAGENCGSVPCETTAVGEPFDCDLLEEDPSQGLLTGAVALAFPTLDNLTFGDSVVTARLEARPRSACVGDCSNDDEVTINELVLGVSIALGSQDIQSCPAFDGDGDGDVSINELVQAVSNALGGCAG